MTYQKDYISDSLTRCKPNPSNHVQDKNWEITMRQFSEYDMPAAIPKVQ